MKWWPSEWVTSFKHKKTYYPFSLCLPPVLPRKAKVVVFNGPLKPSDAVKGNFDWSPHVECVDLHPGRPKIGLNYKIETTTV